MQSSAEDSESTTHEATRSRKGRRLPSDRPFYIGLGVLGGFYVFMILAMLLANASYANQSNFVKALASEEIRYSIILSLVSCSITAVISLWVAVPIGYVLSRYDFRFKRFVDAIIDIPIVMPPLVIGLSLLILFQTPLFQLVEKVIPVTYEIPGVILAQFMVACAFAVRTVRVTFDQISPRCEQVALTLGCTRAQSFWLVVLPEAFKGVIAAATIAWARSLGEFGPLLIFAGATRMRTEVMPTTIFLELSVGNIELAVVVSLLMILVAVIVLILTRSLGLNIRT